MTAAEVDQIIEEHYLAESQALTGAAEANLLKLGELRGTLSEADQARWSEILETFQRQQRLVVAAIDEVAQALTAHQP